MTARAHLRVLVVATAAWGLFWVLGWPSYYQQYSFRPMFWFCVALLPVIAAVTVFILRRVAAERRLPVACWLAFYFTVPLAFYDSLYCGIYLRYGLGFLTAFWYLTLFYVVPWLMLPATAIAMNRWPGGSR
jgi:hypothetical protein